MPDYEVTWQMTGTARIHAADDLTAKEIFDALEHDEVVHNGTVQQTQVIATKEIP